VLQRARGAELYEAKASQQRPGGTNPDGSPRRITTIFYLREIPMFQKHMQEHGGGNGGVLAGGKDMLLSKMLFGPFIELMNIEIISARRSGTPMRRDISRSSKRYGTL